MTDVLELYILEIPKARRILEKELDNKLAQWMIFLDDPNKKEVSKIMEENQEIKKAMNELEEMSEDEELRRLAELKEKAIRDEKNRLRHAIEDGIEEGRRRGLEEGIKQNKLEIAKKLKLKGIETEVIMELTELTEREITEIEIIKEKR